jgi:hypothetical protein
MSDVLVILSDPDRPRNNCLAAWEALNVGCWEVVIGKGLFSVLKECPGCQGSTGCPLIATHWNLLEHSAVGTDDLLDDGRVSTHESRPVGC